MTQNHDQAIWPIIDCVNRRMSLPVKRERNFLLKKVIDSKHN